MKNINVSVILRTYNSATFVQKALDSVKAQTYPAENFELVCVDDGSTDNTVEVLQKFAKIQPNVKIVKNSHSGAINAVNSGIANSSGKYITLLDSDDSFEPNALKKMAEMLDTEKGIGFVYCDYFEKSAKETKIVFVSDVLKTLAMGIMYRREVLDEVGPYDESMVLPEYDIILKAGEAFQGKHIQEPLFTYSRHDGSITYDKAKVELAKEQLRQKYGSIIEKMRSY